MYLFADDTTLWGNGVKIWFDTNRLSLNLYQKYIIFSDQQIKKNLKKTNLI